MQQLVIEFLGTVLFLWALTQYQTPLAAGIALALVMMLFGTTANPAVCLMSYFAGSLSQMTMLRTVATQVLAAYLVTKML